MNNFFTAEIRSINRAEALRYLAYGDNVPDERVTALMDKCEKKLLSAINGKYTYRIFDIASNDGSAVKLEGCTLTMTGHDICSHLEGCEKAALMCATAGAEVDKLIRLEQVSDMAEAVVIDAMSGCAVEAVCDAAEAKIRSEFPQMFMTWRFSAGYGDLPIDIQRQFLEVTNAGRAIGLFSNENSILTPKKSVTAVIGLSEKPVAKKKQGCGSCNLKDTCIFRKKGSRCTYE